MLTSAHTLAQDGARAERALGKGLCEGFREQGGRQTGGVKPGALAEILGL